MSVIEVFKGKGASGFGYGSTAEEVTAGLSLAGKTILVTGCNSGLGLETMRVLALRGARVIGTARSVDKASEAGRGVKGDTVPLACELAEPASVRAAVATIREQGHVLDAIICNAGIMALPALELSYGYEKQFFTNHMGHFLLVTGLLDSLAPDARVVMLSSAAHQGAPRGGVELDNLDGKKGYRGVRAYGQSKIANILFARSLAKRFAGTKKTANAVHPGVIHTNLARYMNPVANFGLSVLGPLVLKTIPQGAATQVYVATHPSLAGISGAYFADCNLAKATRDAMDEAIAERLWKASEEIAAKV